MRRGEARTVPGILLGAGGANFLMGDGAVIFITDSVEPGNIYPGLDPSREDPGSRAVNEEMPPQDWDLAI